MVDSVLESYGVIAEEEPLCLSFCNTVGSRNGESPNEYLADVGKLHTWLIDRNLVSRSTSIDESYRIRALELRDALYGIFSAVAGGREIPEDDLDCFNGELCEALAKLEIGVGLTWALLEPDESERALMLIALSAADLITLSTRLRLRECANATCGWLFLDHSKNQSRRWCSMSDCGNLAKARRFQERKKLQA